jgi:hypothetical protein
MMDKSRIEQLESQGWVQRFIANEPRLSEAVNLYKETGFEVHLEPLPKQEGTDTCSVEGKNNECRTCFAGSEDQYKIIFTRPLKEGPEK